MPPAPAAAPDEPLPDESLPDAGPGRAGRLWRALPGLVRWPNLAIMLLSLALVRGPLLLPGQPLAEALLAPRFGALVLAALLVAAAGYVINDYYDVKIDAINRPERLVVGRMLRRRHAMLAHLVLSGLGVGFAATLSPVVGLVTLGAALLLWGYSARFKRLPLVGNVSIATLTGALIVLPALLPTTALPPAFHQKAVWLYALAAFLLTVVREIMKDLEDMPGDARHGCRTLPLVWGVARSKAVAGFFLACLVMLVLGVVGQLLAWGGRPWLAAWLLALALLPLGWLARLLVRADRRRHYRAASAWCKAIMLAGVLSMLLA